MIIEFEKALRRRIAENAASQPVIEEAEIDEEEIEIDAAQEAREKVEQAAWDGVFTAAETLLQEQGHRVGVGLGKSIGDKVAMVSELMSHGFPPPLDFTQAERIWGLEKDVDFAGEAGRASILARARLSTPINADALIINVGEIELSMSRSEYRRRSDSQHVYFSLSLGGQNVSADLSDANFFNEVITRVRQQASSVTPLSPSPANAQRLLRPRWII